VIEKDTYIGCSRRRTSEGSSKISDPRKYPFDVI
jgi:hypothetical protein